MRIISFSKMWDKLQLAGKVKVCYNMGMEV